MRARLILAALLIWSATTAIADQKRISDVVYGHKEGVALTMDVFEPSKPSGIGVIWVVSGGWWSNHSMIDPNLAQAFTSRGMTVFEVVHGSQPRFHIPDILSDLHRAVRYIRTNASTWGVDPNRIGISGASSGGHVALMTAATADNGDPSSKDPVETASDKVEAVGVFFPPTDMLDFGKTGLDAFDIPALRIFAPAVPVSNATPRPEVERLAKLYSPIYSVTASFPPTLLIHGDADKLVPLQQSQLLDAKLAELKVPHKLIVEPGKGHGWQDMGPDLAQIADWYAMYLKG